MSNAQSRFGRILQDLRQRKVFRAAAAYSVSAWLVVAVADVVFPLLSLPEWALRTLVLVAIAGLPLAALFAWLFDLTPDGVIRTTRQNITPLSAIDRRVDYLIIAVLVAVVAALLIRPDADAQLRSIAVLPFDDFSGDSEYLADGIAEELLNSLVGVEGLRVAARTSSFAFKGRNEDVREIGQRLNVDTVLEGSVQRSGERVRITAQLINVSDGYHLWSERFDRRLDDIFVIQDEIATAIVAALRMKLGADSGVRLAATSSPSFAAYDLYLLGRHHWHQRTPESLRRAVELFRQATEVDPGFARAYSGLADSYLLLRDYGDLSTEEAQSQAEAAIARALQLDDQLAEAYASLGLARMMREDFVAAELAFRNAIELDVSYSMAHMWLGLVLDRVQGPAAAYTEYSAAHSSDPLHPVINSNLASALGRMGRFNEAQRNLQRALDANPEAVRVRMNLAWLAGTYGRFDEAVEWLLPEMISADGKAADDARAILSMNFVAMGEFERAADMLSQGNPQTETENALHARAYLLFIRGEYDRLIDLVELRAGGDPEPGYKAPSRLLMWRGLAELRQGNHDRAVQSLEGFLTADDGHKIEPPERLRLLGVLAHAYRELGDEAGAMRQLELGEATARRAVGQGWASPEFQSALAGHYAMRGDRDRALLALNRAVELGWRDLWSFENDPRFESLQGDAGFARSLGRVRTEIDTMRTRAIELVDAQLAALSDLG